MASAVFVVQPEAGGVAPKGRTPEAQTLRGTGPPQHPENPQAPPQRGRQPANTRSPELCLQEGPADEGTPTKTDQEGGKKLRPPLTTAFSLQASKRVESGEISQEDFLSMAHQINHLFQYQEEKQLRSDSWGGPGELPPKKQAVLTTPGSMQPHSHMDPAELSYFKHKSKLKRTQVNHGAANEDWESQDSLEGGGDPGPASSAAIHPPSHKFSRPPRDRQGEIRKHWSGGSEVLYLLTPSAVSQGNAGVKRGRSLGPPSPP